MDRSRSPKGSLVAKSFRTRLSKHTTLTPRSNDSTRHPSRFGHMDTRKGTPISRGSAYERTGGDTRSGEAPTPHNCPWIKTKPSYVELGGSASHEKSSEEGIPKTFVHNFVICLHFTIRSDSAATAEGTNEDASKGR